jgi:hypothetical protein
LDPRNWLCRYVSIPCDGLAAETDKIRAAVHMLTGVTLSVKCVTTAAEFHRQFRLKQYDFLFVGGTITACYEKAYGYSVLLEAQLSGPCMVLALS